MSVTVESGSTVPFERFWRWLRGHTNCILRAGTADTWLFDQEDLHWQLADEHDQGPVVQLLRGKQLLGELLLNVREVLFVQATPDEESGEKGAFLFELVTGQDEETFPAYHFLLSHGLGEETGGHTSLKH